MTREELALRINSFEKDNRKWEWPFVAIYILGMAAIGILFARPADDSNLIAGLAIVTLFIWILIPIPILGKINKKRMRALGLNCPACDVSLAGGVGRLAVTTLYCSQCGTRILEDQTGEQGADDQAAAAVK